MARNCHCFELWWHCSLRTRRKRTEYNSVSQHLSMQNSRQIIYSVLRTQCSQRRCKWWSRIRCRSPALACNGTIATIIFVSAAASGCNRRLGMSNLQAMLLIIGQRSLPFFQNFAVHNSPSCVFC